MRADLLQRMDAAKEQQNHACQARQYSDQMVCEVCNLAWDANDPQPPECSHAIYAERDIEALGIHYDRHISAITEKGLTSKREICAELAQRDQVITSLLRALKNTEAASASHVDQQPLVGMLTDDNKAMRWAGCQLAEAALRVIREYDGTHRLAAAVAKWTEVISKEGGRA